MDCSTGRERNNHDNPVRRSHCRDESNHSRILDVRCSSLSQNNKETNGNEKEGTNNNNSSVNKSANNNNNNNNNSIAIKRRIKPPKSIRKTSFFSKERFCFVKIRNNHDSRFQQPEKQQRQKNGGSTTTTCSNSSIPLILLWPGLMINDLQKCWNLADNNNSDVEEEEEESLLSKINTIRRINNNNNSNVRMNDTNEDDDANRQLFQDCTQAALTDSRAGVFLFGSTKKNKVIPYKYDDVYFLNSNNSDGRSTSASATKNSTTICDIDVIRIVEENIHITGHQEAIKECTDFFKQYGTGAILQGTSSSSSKEVHRSRSSINAVNIKSNTLAATGRFDNNGVSSPNHSLTSPSSQGATVGNNNVCIGPNKNDNTHHGPLSPSSGSSNDVAKNSNTTTDNTSTSSTTTSSPTINDHNMELFLESMNRSARSGHRLLINSDDVASNTEEVEEKDNNGNGNDIAKRGATEDDDTTDNSSSSVTVDDTTKKDLKTNTQLLDTDDSYAKAFDDAQNILGTNQSLHTDSFESTELLNHEEYDDGDTILVPAITNNKTDKDVLIWRAPISRSRNDSKKKMKKICGRKTIGKPWTSYEKGSFQEGITLFWDPTVNGQYNDFAKVMHDRKLLMNRTAKEILNYATYYFEKRATTNIMHNECTTIRHSPAIKLTSLLDHHRVKDPDMLEDVQRRAAAYFEDNGYIMNEDEFTDEEHALFSNGITLLGTPCSGLETFGKEIDYYKLLPTRTVRQIINHARTFFIEDPRRSKKTRIRTTTVVSAFDRSETEDSTIKPKEPQGQNSKSSYWETEQCGPRKRRKPFWQTDNNGNGNTDTTMTSRLTKALPAARNKVAQSRPPRTQRAKAKNKSRITSTATVPKYVKEKLTTSTAATKMNMTAKAKTKMHKAARTKKTKASLKIRDIAVDRKPTPTQQLLQQEHQQKREAGTPSIVPTKKVKLKTVHDDSWYVAYAVLVDFYRLNGHTSVLRSDPNQKLMGWVKRQRNNRRVGKLCQKKIDELDQLRFVWHRTNHAWDAKYNMLVEYQKKFGHCIVPSETFYLPLSGWINRQKHLYRSRHEFKYLTPDDRTEALQKIPGWSWEI